MKITTTRKFDFSNDDTIAVFISDGNPLNDYSGKLEHLQSEIDFSRFTKNSDKSFFIPLKNHAKVIIINIGETSSITPEKLKMSAASMQKLSASNNIKEVKVIMPEGLPFDDKTVALSICEGIYLSNYAFNEHKTKPENKKNLLSGISLVNAPDGIGKKINDLSIICENVNQCRNLINDTSENVTPLTIAEYSRKMASKTGIKCTVLDEKAIMSKKLGLISAVAKGGAYPPRMVILEYMHGKKKGTTTLVGKGITFDTGGLNLKPTGSIETMRYDMAGAATVIHSIKAIAELGLEINVSAVIPLCENGIDSKAYKPGDVFKSYAGITVQVQNTDAEGRLILADAISYAEKTLKPDSIIDIATLTGACRVSFGEEYAALLSNDSGLADAIKSASAYSGDKVWELPLDETYNENIKSEYADINNVSADRNAGTIIGAVFLKNFIKNTKWAHVDIASTAWLSKENGYKPKNASGFGVRLLVETLKNLNN